MGKIGIHTGILPDNSFYMMTALLNTLTFPSNALFSSPSQRLMVVNKADNSQFSIGTSVFAGRSFLKAVTQFPFVCGSFASSSRRLSGSHML